MKQILQILKGWTNVLRDELEILDEETQKLSLSRLKICDKCLLRSGTFCATNRRGKNIKTGEMSSGCGCVLIAKTKVKEAECPLSKW